MVTIRVSQDHLSESFFKIYIYIFPARQVQPPSVTQPLSGITRFYCSDRWSKAVTAMRTTTVRHHPYLTSQLACCQKKPAVARDELIVNRFLLAVKAMCFSDTRNYSWALANVDWLLVEVGGPIVVSARCDWQRERAAFMFHWEILSAPR